MTLEQLVKGYTLAQIEELYRLGAVSQDVFEQYCSLWRNSVYRFSSLCEAYAHIEQV